MNTSKELWKIAEFVRCARNPIYFLSKYALIKSTEGKFIPFKLYPYQVSLLKDLTTHALLIMLKNRQVGATWIIAGYTLWKAMFQKAANCIIVSKDEDAAMEVLDYCRFIYNHLPKWLQPDLDKNRTSLLEFTTLSSKIRALPATTASGVGFGSASLIIMDEFDFHPKAEENYVEIKPMIDAGEGRQLVILSAPNRITLNSAFKNLWRNARKGRNNFHPVLIPFGVVPNHTEEWYQKMSKDYEKRDLETRYFRTEDEALSVTTAGKFFDAEKLSLMNERVLNPISKYKDIDLRNGIINIYKPPSGSIKYCMFCDPSEGVEDPFHIVVLDVSNKEEVANAHGRLPSDEVALIYSSLAKHYNDATNSFYRSGYSGARFQMALENLHVPNQMYSRDLSGKDNYGEYGYWESGVLKKQLLGNLRDSIAQIELIIHDAKTIDEFNMMFWLDGDKAPKVPDNEHDDRIVCWAGALDVLKRIPCGKIEIVTFIPSGSSYHKFKGGRYKFGSNRNS